MSAVIQQIKTAYELNKMTVEEIAEDQGLEPIAVKSALIQGSSKYRKDCGMESADVEDGLNFTNDELRQVNQVILTVALTAEDMEGNPDWRARLDAAKYIRDDKKGRKEVVRAVAGNTFNILSFNEQLQAARSRADEMKRVISS